MKKSFVLTWSMAIFTVLPLLAQEEEATPSTAQANNPLANMTALSFQNYYIPKLSESPDGIYMNTTWVRLAKPLSGGKFLLRASLPLSTLGVPNTAGVINTESGLGDINAFLSYNFFSNATTTIGIGPSITAPTASNDLLGAGKWQLGFAFVAFLVQSETLQIGSLITWQASVAGDDSRSNTNLGAFQPFYIWQLGKGTYLRGVPTWAFDFEKEAYSVPFALGIGKVIKVDNTVFNMYVEPQYSVYIKGAQPIFQILTGINLQFMK
ncbi:MAG: hypothetical protein HC819_23245 [Cyclobacteriaceae bacterium]|nr:hypothetical protein [Cyclobacteriaceae bacterium]